MTTVREGDWNCESCGDHQFERNLMCRKCGTPKPTISSNNQASKAGDWICPNPLCKDLQFERNALCRKCGTPKPFLKNAPRAAVAFKPGVGGPAGFAMPMTPMVKPVAMVRPDDWRCMMCGDHQFAKNTSCRQCGAPKPILATNKQAPKPGDWICPNPECKDVQFERNAVCRKCGTEKPEGAASPVMAGAGGPGLAGGKASAMQGFPGGCAGCGAFPGFMGMPGMPGMAGMAGMPGMAGMAGMPMGGAWGKAMAGGFPFWRAMGPMQMQMMQMQMAAMAGGAGGMRPGDWVCPGCQDVQFERNQACRKCGTAKPIVATNKQMFKEGDWICPNPECKDVQFAKNPLCRKCGSSKPAEDPMDPSILFKFAADGSVARSRSPTMRAAAAARVPGFPFAA